jgi:nucleotide-binding universal stress UspA family protein
MFKTIVVHVDDTDAARTRVQAAALLANTFGAHLVGSAATGVTYASYAMLFGSMAVPATQSEYDALRLAARAPLAHFSQTAQGLGVSSLEERLLDEETRVALHLQSRYADLLVVSRDTPASHGSALADVGGLPAYLALHTARPVLVVPPNYAGAPLLEHIAVGWDGSEHALRAISAAIPLMQRAAAVKLILVNPNPVLDLHGQEPGADMALYLARHGIPVEVLVQQIDRHPGEVILQLAQDQGCGMIVAGAYAHSRLRELILGGVTRTLLSRSPLPLLLAH